MRSEGCSWIWLALGLFCAPMAWGEETKGKDGSNGEPKATLSVGSLQDLTFWIDPSRKENEIGFRVREASGKLAIEGLQAEVLAAYLEIDDEIKVIPAHSTEPWIHPLGEAWKVPTQGSADLRFKVRAPPKNGLLKVDLLLSSKDLRIPKTVTIQIATRHHWFGPMIVIALGVFLGYLVVYYGHSRPKEENRAALASLRLASKRNSLPAGLVADIDGAAEANEGSVLAWTHRNRVEVLKVEMSKVETTEASTAQVKPDYDSVRRRERFVAMVALVVAILTAFRSLYLDGLPFGSAADYIDAFLWGSGVQVTVRGFGPVLDALRKLVARP
ncbi:MAG: hypothetical protein AAGN66_22880 [Acidobacteriota bacterium]